MPLQHQPNKFVVAIDGSKLGFRAAKFAAFLCRPKNGDSIQLVTICTSDSVKAMTEHVNLAKTELLALGVSEPARRIRVDCTITNKESMGKKTIADILCEAASGGCLVMGAGGMRLQDEWLKKKSNTPLAAIGSVAEACMSMSKAPVIIRKRKAAPMLDKETFIRQRGESGNALSIVVAVTEGKDDHMATKSFDMSKRCSQKVDKVHVVHVKGDAHKERGKEIDAYWEDLKDKVNATDDGEFQYKAIDKAKGARIDQVLNAYADSDDVLADLVIVASRELTKLDGQALGSVSAAIAKSTEANVMISKHFAQ